MGWGKCLGIELMVASTWVGGKCLGIELRWQVHGLGASVWE